MENYVEEAHAEAESWLSKHKWPIMLALFCAAVIAVGLLVA